MKILISIVALLSLTGCFAPLSKQHKALEVGFQVVNATDFTMTSKAIHAGMKELNPIIGSSPSDTTLFFWGAGSGLAHYTVTKALPEQYRPYWLWPTLLIKTAVVGHNFTVMEW